MLVNKDHFQNATLFIIQQLINIQQALWLWVEHRYIKSILNKLIPPSRDYFHEQTWHDGNGHSHLQATWLGPEITVPVSNGKLILGTWQQIFHLECDVKSRQRQVVVTVYGE